MRAEDEDGGGNQASGPALKAELSKQAPSTMHRAALEPSDEAPEPSFEEQSTGRSGDPEPLPVLRRTRCAC